MKRTGAYGLLMLISYHWRIFFGRGGGGSPGGLGTLWIKISFGIH